MGDALKTIGMALVFMLILTVLVGVMSFNGVVVGVLAFLLARDFLKFLGLLDDA